MEPGDLILHLRKGGQPEAGYLFLGAEPFYRNRCAKALREAVLGADPDPSALVEVDLRERSLDALVEEARTQSLFSAVKLVVGRNAEQALPRTKGKTAQGAAQHLRDYFEAPVPGTVVILEAVRYDSQDREEKQKLQRVGKFFADVPVRIDLQALSVQRAQFVGRTLAKRMGLAIPEPILADLVEMLGADAFRIENELEKLALYAGQERPVSHEDLEALVPEAKQSGVFEFSQALAARDRTRAMDLLGTMAKAGVYWPLQLNLIAGLFRQALAAKELGLRDARQIGAQLGSRGIRIWPARARQVEGIVAKFGVDELRSALVALFEADRGLRTPRPDDRLVVEMLVMKLTR